MGKHDTPKANDTQEAMVIGAPYIYSCECDTSVIRVWCVSPSSMAP